MNATCRNDLDERMDRMNTNENAEVLMAAFQSGNTDAIAELYTLYRSPLYCFMFRLTQDKQLSIDLVQDTFLQLHRYFERFQLR